jgi:endonuclease/exonuclease/phosphatase (EEP) superfamily protein YafD
VGVLTASKTGPFQATRMKSRKREFGITVPKAAMASYHPMPNREVLLAVNVHCLNFERCGTKAISDQLADIRRIMSLHDGPIVFAGDFNTWSRARYQVVLDLAEEFSLHEVESFIDHRKTGDQGSSLMNRLFGIDKELALDRVFYRGLVPMACEVLDYDSSDHRALMVTFDISSPNPINEELALVNDAPSSESL